MSIKETILEVVDKLEADIAARELALSEREEKQAREQTQFNTSAQALTQKEKTLVDWEATLRDREESISTSVKKIQEEKAAFEKEQKEFKQWRTMEMSRLESQNQVLTAEQKAFALTKESFTKTKKEQEIIKEKLIAERASLDSAWTEFKYNNLKNA